LETLPRHFSLQGVFLQIKVPLLFQNNLPFPVSVLVVLDFPLEEPVLIYAKVVPEAGNSENPSILQIGFRSGFRSGLGVG